MANGTIPGDKEDANAGAVADQTDATSVQIG